MGDKGFKGFRVIKVFKEGEEMIICCNGRGNNWDIKEEGRDF